jgi:hypothetical protein
MMKILSSTSLCLVVGALACGGRASNQGDGDGDGDGDDEGTGGNGDPGTGGVGGTGGVVQNGSGGRGSGGTAGSGGNAAGGGDQGTGGGPVLTECIECEEGYECFEDVAFDRCFKICATEVPNVELYTQADVDALAALDCEVIANDLSIASPDINSLLGLEKLHVVKGSFSISGTSTLTSLDGLICLLWAT